MCPFLRNKEEKRFAMDPREFLNWYAFDERLISGEYFSPEPVSVEEGDHIGVVLLNLGGPDDLDAVQPFLYRLFMDPAIIDFSFWGVSLPDIFRPWLSSFIADRRAEDKKEEYEAIGGKSPINELTFEQSDLLEENLNENWAERLGVEFSTEVAMRYWRPTSEDAARNLEEKGVDKIVLLPLYPQYSKTTTGSSLSYWKALEDTGEIPEWPTTFVREYATHPRYVAALNDRINEALNRFPEEERDHVHLLFSAHGTPLDEMIENRDPYCCLVHSTIHSVLQNRPGDRPFHSAFQSKVGPGKWLEPSTLDKLEQLGQQGVKSVLLIPIAFVTDHIETRFELDIEAREEAEEMGIEHFEVMEGLNDHPRFIEALAEVTVSQLDSPKKPRDASFEKGGESVTYDLQAANLRPRRSPENRTTECIQCRRITEAVTWDRETT